MLVILRRVDSARSSSVNGVGFFFGPVPTWAPPDAPRRPSHIDFSSLFCGLFLVWLLGAPARYRLFTSATRTYTSRTDSTLFSISHRSPNPYLHPSPPHGTVKAPPESPPQELSSCENPKRRCCPVTNRLL